jgi:hypothetical protein
MDKEGHVAQQMLVDFFSNNFTLLVGLGVVVTIVGVVFAIGLAVWEVQRSKAGMDGRQAKRIRALNRKTNKMMAELEGVKSTIIRHEKMTDEQLKALRNELRTTVEELAADLNKKHDHLKNICAIRHSETSDTSDTFQGQRNSASKDQTKSGEEDILRRKFKISENEPEAETQEGQGGSRWNPSGWPEKIWNIFKKKKI